jgi:hypothetical protein
MKVKILFFLALMLFSNCGNRDYQNITVDNPVLRHNVVFQGYEDLTSPKFSHLINKYQLDTIFHGEQDEFRRILMLRRWIKSVIRIDDFGDPYPGAGDVEAILDNALKGQGYHCGHFMIVQNAILNAYGYVTRTLGAGPGVKGGPDGHHGINEVWLNQFNKWFLSDAKYDHHFEKDGIPLSALEIRDEFLKNKAVDIVKVKGPGRVPFDIDSETGYSREQNAQTYTWIEWHGNNDMFTIWPESKDILIMYEDEFFKTHTWIWGGQPHWAYAKPEFMKLVQSRDQIYWTPNTIAADVKIEGSEVIISLTSETPNLKEYQIKRLLSEGWVHADSVVNLDLKEKGYEILFRAVNIANVSGPEYRLKIESKKE